MPRELPQLQITIDDTSGYRSCGTCNLCCVLQGVEELDKPINVKCRHLNVMGRCGVYGDRPPSCREYKCLWLRGYMPEALKPVRSRMVVEHNDKGDMLVVRVLPQDRHLIRRGVIRAFILRANLNKVPVIVVCGEERTLFGARPQDMDVILKAESIKGGERVVEEVTYNIEVMR
jgi:hypothetical protein